MATAGKAVIDILLNSSGLKSGLGAVQGAMRGIGSVASAAFAGATVAAAAMTAGVYKAISAINEQHLAEAKLAAVLKATGGAAGFTTDQLVKQAEVLQEVTIFGDDAIISMQAVLATFRNVKGDHFTEAQDRILDLATVLDTDLKSAALQVGKALNDPIAGVSALGRAGIQFTDTQKEMIASMMEMGDVAGAQRIILDELANQVGGAATTAGQTFAGQLTQLNNAIGEVWESVGSALIPVLQPLVAQFKEFLPVLAAGLVPAVKALANSMIDMGAGIITFLGGWEKVQKAIQVGVVIFGHSFDLMEIALLQFVKFSLENMDMLWGGIIRGLGAMLQKVNDIWDIGLGETAKKLQEFNFAGDLTAGMGERIAELEGKIADSLANAASPPGPVEPPPGEMGPPALLPEDGGGGDLIPTSTGKRSGFGQSIGITDLFSKFASLTANSGSPELTEMKLQTKLLQQIAGKDSPALKNNAKPLVGI